MREHCSKGTIKKGARQASPGTIQYIYERDGGTCVYCGNAASELDHVISIKDGGPSAKSNLVCSCSRCNQKKHNHPNDPSWLTKAIFRLLSAGEDISWMDDYYELEDELQD